MIFISYRGQMHDVIPVAAADPSVTRAPHLHPVLKCILYPDKEKHVVMRGVSTSETSSIFVPATPQEQNKLII